MRRMGNSEADVSDMKDTIRNTFAKMAKSLSGRGDQNDVGELGDVEMLFQLQGDFGSTQKECGGLRNLKNVDDLGRVGVVIRLQKENKERRIRKTE